MSARLLAGLLLVSIALAKPPAAPLDERFKLPDMCALDNRKLDEPPRILRRQEAIYPEHLVDNYIDVLAFVLVRVELDAAGSVTGAKVSYASHPAFVPPTLTAIAGSTFSAGRIGGQPVASFYNYKIVYNVIGYAGGLVGKDVARVVTGKIPGLPEQFDYDDPPVLFTFCEPIYPRELLEHEVKGEASVRVVLDEKGRMIAGEVLSATLPEFGAAFLAAVDFWRFDPAKRKGVATPTVIDLQHKFLPAGFRRPVAETQALKTVRGRKGKLSETSALDRPLKPLYRVEPQYPHTLAGKKPVGRSVVEFVVYENGQAVLPQVISADQPEFGLAVATAVQQWVFDRPVSGGKPVSARHRLTFAFDPVTGVAQAE